MYKNIKETPVSDIMTCQVCSCNQEDDMTKAQKTMSEKLAGEILDAISGNGGASGRFCDALSPANERGTETAGGNCAGSGAGTGDCHLRRGDFRAGCVGTEVSGRASGQTSEREEYFILLYQSRYRTGPCGFPPSGSDVSGKCRGSASRRTAGGGQPSSLYQSADRSCV